MADCDWTKWADDKTKELLKSLSIRDVEQNRQAMVTLGAKLAEVLLQDLSKSELMDHDICVACTVEDADYLAAGVFKKLEEAMPGKCNLACFWNEKTSAPEGLEEFEIAPILKQYKEPVRPDKCVLVFVKSIVSDACFVATNINNLISDLNPTEIYVLAPVMLAGSERRVQGHFPSSIVQRFHYLRFAVDRGKYDSGWVDPGVGFGNEQQKNMIVPEIVKARREKMLAR